MLMKIKKYFIILILIFLHSCSIFLDDKPLDLDINYINNENKFNNNTPPNGRHNTRQDYIKQQIRYCYNDGQCREFYGI